MKKRFLMKKLFALALSMMMVLAMAVPAFAAEGDPKYSITVSAQSPNVSIKGNEFSAYKLFDVKYNEGATSFAYTVASEFSEFTYAGKSGAELVKYVGELTKDSDELNAFAQAALKYATDNNIAAKGKVTVTDTNNLIALNEPGYYLVAGTATADGNKTVTAACSLTTTKPTADIKVKADAPKLDKVIEEGDTDKEGASADIGSTVDFKLTSKVPDMTGYSAYKYIVHDTMSSGLTFNNDIVVKIGEKTLTAEEYTLTVPGADGETFTIDIKNFISYNKGDDIVITYSATVNENALNTSFETNTANLEYSNNPNDTSDTETTPDDIVYVYDFNVDIDKYITNPDNNADTSQKLAGAQFVLKNGNDADAKYYQFKDGKVSWVSELKDATIVTSTATGKGDKQFEGLAEGIYYLEEIKAPDGYNKLSDPVKVEITATYKADGELNSTSATLTNDGKDYEQIVSIGNAKGGELPGTGGIGTTIFYVVGGLLMVAAVVLLVAKKKMSVCAE